MDAIANDSSLLTGVLHTKLFINNEVSRGISYILTLLLHGTISSIAIRNL